MYTQSPAVQLRPLSPHSLADAMKFRVDVLEGEGTPWERWRALSGLMATPEHAEDYIAECVQVKNAWHYRVQVVFEYEYTACEYDPVPGRYTTGD